MEQIPEKDSTTEAAILEAAESLFLEKGFALTSTVAIAKKAGCNQALVHYYFRSKEKLFEAVFQKKAALFLSSLLQISQEDLSFEEKLTKKIGLHFDMLRKNPRLPFLLFNELSTNPKRLLAIKQQLSTLPASLFFTLKQELDNEIQKGTVRQLAPIDLVLLILSLNVMPFLARPIITNIGVFDEAAMEAFYDRKKQENIEIILRAIRP